MRSERQERVKYQAKLEQAGFLARLSNDEYINKLQMEGQKARLDDENKFKIEYAKQAFQDQKALVQDNLKFEAMMNASDREFEESLARMSVDDVIRIVEENQKAAREQERISGWQSIISGGLVTGGGAYADAKKDTGEQSQQQPSSGGGGQPSGGMQSTPNI